MKEDVKINIVLSIYAVYLGCNLVILFSYSIKIRLHIFRAFSYSPDRAAMISQDFIKISKILANHILQRQLTIFNC